MAKVLGLREQRVQFFYDTDFITSGATGATGPTGAAGATGCGPPGAAYRGAYRPG